MRQCAQAPCQASRNSVGRLEGSAASIHQEQVAGPVPRQQDLRHPALGLALEAEKCTLGRKGAVVPARQGPAVLVSMSPPMPDSSVSRLLDQIARPRQNRGAIGSHRRPPCELRLLGQPPCCAAARSAARSAQKRCRVVLRPYDM